MSRIGILGAGSWGTALALNLSRRTDHEVILWAHTPEHAAALAGERENRRYLPGFALPATITVTDSLAAAAKNAEAVLFVMPSQHLRIAAGALAPFLEPGTMLLSAAKGIEDATLLRMTEVMTDALAHRARQHAIGVLSGPSFAQEVAAGAPAAVTVALPRMEDAERAQAMLTTGAVAGLELGHNRGAAIITRGIA